MNTDDSIQSEQKKPLAGDCRHDWQNQESRYVVAQVCEHCKLYRYKSGNTADWEYRAPIPFGAVPVE